MSWSYYVEGKNVYFIGPDGKICTVWIVYIFFDAFLEIKCQNPKSMWYMALSVCVGGVLTECHQTGKNPQKLFLFINFLHF